MKNDFQTRRENRIRAYENLARRKREEANCAAEQAYKLADAIPVGQPILVGHYSEKRHRRDIKRIQDLGTKSVNLVREAEYYEERAKAAKLNKSISSDDPEVLQKLRDKLAKLEALHEKMKKTNKLIRKQDKQGLVELGYTEQQIQKLLAPDYCGRIGIPAFELSNNNAEMRRLRKRIEEEEAKQSQQTSEIEIGDIKIVDNVEANRIQIFFPGKPSEEIRKQLKSKGFRWAPSVGAWQCFRHQNNEYLLSQIKKIFE